MENRPLGRTNVSVSALCLGTMTWGEQNSESEAHAQLDYAFDHGVNFIDTAEAYPIPPRAETQGLTESYIGTWLAARGVRDKVVLATKAVGRSNLAWLRGGETRLDRSNIEAAIDASLKRLRTDYVDLYQLHSTERRIGFAGDLGYRHVADADDIAIEETLAALGDLVKAGKVRHLGVSNETPWGVMRFLAEAQAAGRPRLVSIQNAYSLLNRSFEAGLAEIGMREGVGLLAYSPMAMGLLSGKYAGGAKPAGSRLAVFERYASYASPQAAAATEAYVALAREHGLEPAQMALVYVAGRPFVTAAIIGATSMAQLEGAIASAEITLSEEVLREAEAIHRAQPNPPLEVARARS